MKAERPYPQIAITPKGEAALTGGHPWVYEGEVTSVSGAPADGDLGYFTTGRKRCQALFMRFAGKI